MVFLYQINFILKYNKYFFMMLLLDLNPVKTLPPLPPEPPSKTGGNNFFPQIWWYGVWKTCRGAAYYPPLGGQFPPEPPLGGRERGFSTPTTFTNRVGDLGKEVGERSCYFLPPQGGSRYMKGMKSKIKKRRSWWSGLKILLMKIEGFIPP